jgi:selT/selW/selH-like putative selenoprotein
VKQALETAFGTQIEVAGNSKPNPRSRSFEVTIGDTLLYSKLETKQFPAVDAIVAKVTEHIAGTGGGASNDEL